MGTVSASKINDALAKARNVGIVEEQFDLGDCSVVLRNLRPEEYAQIVEGIGEADDVEYAVLFQIGHVSRSIVEINGVDFRDVDFVEVEEPDPKREGHTKTVKLEKHTYLERYILSTWSKESLFTAYRKFGDVVAKAEQEAKKGVKFLLPEETPEEKYRRLLEDAIEIHDELPDSLILKILDEHGLSFKRDEMEGFTKDEEEPAEGEPVAAPEPPAPTPSPAPAAPTPTLNDVLAKRQPLNRQPAPLPPDPHQVIQQPAPPSIIPQRAKEIAELEAEAGVLNIPQSLPGPQGGMIPVAPRDTLEVAEIKAPDKVDPRVLTAVIDQPPPAGLNPRFRRPRV